MELGAEPKEVVADKGYHSKATMTGVKKRRQRSYVSEPKPGPPEVEGQAGRAEGHVRQPPPDQGRAGEAAAAPEG